MFETPNLDGLSIDADDLDKAAEVLETLARYARRKAKAMRARLSGDVNTALRHEATMERLYETLPEWARW
jgi:hypothetical protein